MSENRTTTFKKNKKKSRQAKFLQNAKRFGKKGSCGRGTHVEEDEYQYFISVLDSLRADFEDIESKVIMANNVFKQTNGREVYLASNQVACKVLEFLVGFVDAERLEKYFEVFADCFRPICSDRFASHVLQKMVEIAFLRSVSKEILKKNGSESQKQTKKYEEREPHLAKKLKMQTEVFSEENYNLETEFTQEHKANCGNFVLRVGKFMLNNLEDFIWNTQASYIMRTCILCLSGTYVPKNDLEKGVNLVNNDRKIYEVSSEWYDVCREFVRRLEMWPQFNELPYKATSSALLSILCIATKTIDNKMMARFAKNIITSALITAADVEDDEGEERTSSPKCENAEDTKDHEKTIDAKVFHNNLAIMLLETLISVAGPKLFTKIYNMLFINKLALLSKNPLTHFAVKKLLNNVKEKSEFENMFEELKEHIEELCKIDHTSIVTSLSSACLRFQTKQAQLIAALQSALHLSGDRLKSFFLCLLKLKPFEILQEDKTNYVNLNGTLLIQDLLHFNKPIFLVNCILETPPSDLAEVFKNVHGSHICDHYLQSKFIGEKSRDKLIKHLEGFYVDLAISKFGSRSIESIFASAQDTQKEKIVKELAHKLNELQSTPFGSIINQKMRVDVYRLSADQWKASLKRKKSKAQTLFKDITD